MLVDCALVLVDCAWVLVDCAPVAPVTPVLVDCAPVLVDRAGGTVTGYLTAAIAAYLTAFAYLRISMDESESSVGRARSKLEILVSVGEESGGKVVFAISNRLSKKNIDDEN